MLGYKDEASRGLCAGALHPETRQDRFRKRSRDYSRTLAHESWNPDPARMRAIRDERTRDELRAEAEGDDAPDGHPGSGRRVLVGNDGKSRVPTGLAGGRERGSKPRLIEATYGEVQMFQIDVGNMDGGAGSAASSQCENRESEKVTPLHRTPRLSPVDLPVDDPRRLAGGAETPVVGVCQLVL